MHCKKLHSEYTKRFKDPHWEAHWQCYEELLRYRRSRRLREQSHCPWLWEGWEEASDSCSCNSNSTSCCCNPKRPPEPDHFADGPPVGDEQQKGEATVVTDTRNPDLPELSLALEKVEERNNEKAEEQTKVNENKSVNCTRLLSAFPNAGGHKSVKNFQRKTSSKEIRHPFALYACGEKMLDTASQKTHNVCAPASSNEIHESALRAKNRRQKEKRKQMLQKQRVRSAEMEKFLKRKSPPADNPWLTEYMRCYSARTR